MLKGRAPYPFETIALAVSFNPALASLVKETKRMCELYNAQAVFIHIGKKTSENQRELTSALLLNGFHDGNSKIFWEQGDVVSTLLKVCKKKIVDLLLIGASDKDNLKLPVGNISRGIAKKAKCSVLIYTGRPTGSFNSLVVNGTDHRKTELTISTSLYLADKEKCSIINIVDGKNASAYVESGRTDFRKEAGSNMNVDSPVADHLIINHINLLEEQCATMAEYAFKNNADLIITFSTDHHLHIFDRFSPKDGIEQLLNSLSSNLLIVHSRVHG